MAKRHFNKLLLLLTLFVGSLHMALAQDEFTKGSIVTSNHDTLYCFIREHDLRENSVVSYKIKKDDTKIIRLKKAEYLRVQMGRTVYEKLSVTDSTDVGNGYLLSERVLKLISNGYIKLYADIHNHGGSLNATYGKYESFHMRKGNESLLKINRIGYKGTLRNQLQEMPEINTKLDNLSFGDIPELINIYNLWFINK